MAEYWVVSKKDQIWKCFSFNLMTIQMKAHSHFEDLFEKSQITKLPMQEMVGWWQLKFDQTSGDLGSVDWTAAEVAIEVLDVLIV